MVAQCINNFKHFIVQLTHTNFKNLRIFIICVRYLDNKVFEFRKLSVKPCLRDSSDLCVGRKMATFQLFFQSGRSKDLSAPL